MTLQDDTFALRDEQVLDTAHLDRMALGDAELRREILCLFRREAADAVSRLALAGTAEEWNIAAHTLKGSSRSVGAMALAAVAENAELHEAEGRAAALSAVGRAVAAVLPLIDRELAT